MQELRQFSQLVDLIYQGATSFEAWPKILEGLCDYIDAPRGVLFTPVHTTETGGFALGHNFSKELSVWETKMQKHDLWTQRAFERGLAYTGCVMRDQDLITDEELFETVMYKEIFQPIGCGRMLSGVIFSPLDNDEITVACTMHRELNRPYEQEHVEKYELILPHTSRALGVMFRLRDAEFRVASNLMALDRLPTGIALINTEGNIIYHNRAAKQIFDQQDGIQLFSTNTLQDTARLKASDSTTQTTLNAAINDCIVLNMRATKHFSKSLAVPRPSGKSAFALNFSALPLNNEYGVGKHIPCAIVFIADSAKHIKLDESILKNSYGLTQAEIRLAELLANGDTNEETADKLSVSVNTTKSQLQQIYQKTDTNSRAKLTKFLLSLAKMEG